VPIKPGVSFALGQKSLRSIGGNLLALLPVLYFAASAAETRHGITLECATDRVGKYQKIEFTLGVSSSYTNPFNPDEVDVTVRFTTPEGQLLRIPAFWYQPYERRRLTSDNRTRDWLYPSGPPIWKARFAPNEIGPYEAVAILKDSEGTSVSRRFAFECVRSPSKGFVRVSTRDPRFLEFSEGQPFFAIGQNLAFIGSQQYVTLSKTEEIFSKLAENGANYLRVWACCEDWAMAIEARKSAFGRSWNWHPQIVPMPDAESSGLKCLKLAGDKNVLRVDPSHPIALRPGTRYMFSGKIRASAEAGPAAAFKVELGGKSVVPVIANSKKGWREFKHEFETGADEYWLAPLSLRLEGQGTAWVSELSLRQEGTGPELLWEADVNRSIRGYYNPLDCFMLDEVVSAAETKGILLQLCLLTRDLYMNALKDPSNHDYDLAIHDAFKTLRYAVARWGYSTSVAAWEYWNEMDPGLPTEKFYGAIGEYLKFVDPYRHLRTTSTWGPSAKDCRHPALDLADIHFYLRKGAGTASSPNSPPKRQPNEDAAVPAPVDEVDAVLERTAWLREQAPAKPAHLGEFGLANEKWQPTEEMNQSRETVDLHNALWASALSGASGTAMFWWWERLDRLDFYPQYRPLKDFIADVPWTTGVLQSLAASCSEPRVRALGLRSQDRAWLWLFNREASWAKIVVDQHAPSPIAKAEIQLSELPAGNYVIKWWDTRQGAFRSQETQPGQDGRLKFVAPEFSHDIACLIAPASSQP